MPGAETVAVSVATRSGLSGAAIAQLAAEAERLGLGAFYLAESAADSLVLSQAALAATHRLPVGTAIANARLRHPAAAAMAALSLNELFDGRFRLGLGVSNAAFNETALGMAEVRPVDFLRDYLHEFRRVVDGAVRLDRAPGGRRPRVAIAAMQPRMLRLGGALADGVVLSLTTQATLPAALAEVAAGAAQAGRDPAEIDISCVLPCCFADDTDGTDAAYEAGRNLVLGYARHRAAARVFAAHGLADRLPRILAALESGDDATARKLIDPELVASLVLVDATSATERIAAYRAAGVTQPILFPVPGAGDWDDAVRRAMELAPVVDRAPARGGAAILDGADVAVGSAASTQPTERVCT